MSTRRCAALEDLRTYGRDLQPARMLSDGRKDNQVSYFGVEAAEKGLRGRIRRNELSRLRVVGVRHRASEREAFDGDMFRAQRYILRRIQ